MRITKVPLDYIDGVPVYPFFGADGEDDQSGETDDTVTEDDAQGEDEGDDDDDEDDPVKRKLRKTTRQSIRRQKELTAALKEKQELQDKLDAEERKKKNDLDNATGDLAKRDERISNLESLLNKNLLETAILKDAKRTWHDVSQTIAALPEGEVTIDLDTGEVNGLEEALAEVAKEKPFLVKETKGRKKVDQNGSTDNPGQGNQQRGSTGYNPGGAGNQQKNGSQINRDDLVKRIPALRR